MPQPRSAPAAGDAVAISLSGLCLAHCLALPLLAGLLPLAGAWAEAEWVHWLFAAIAAPVSLLTLTRPADRSPSILPIALIGLAFLFAGAAGFPSHDLETPLTVTGGLLLAAAHLLNGRRRAACAHDA